MSVGARSGTVAAPRPSPRSRRRRSTSWPPRAPGGSRCAGWRVRSDDRPVALPLLRQPRRAAQRVVTDSHNALADAAEAAAAATRGQPPRERRLATTGAFRGWALANPSAFLLLYGTPVPASTRARVGRAERGACGSAGRSPKWCPTSGHLTRSPPSRCRQNGEGCAAAARGRAPRARPHCSSSCARTDGRAMLELGVTVAVRGGREQFFTAAMGRMSDELEVLRGTLQSGVSPPPSSGSSCA